MGYILAGGQEPQAEILKGLKAGSLGHVFMKLSCGVEKGEGGGTHGGGCGGGERRAEATRDGMMQICGCLARKVGGGLAILAGAETAGPTSKDALPGSCHHGAQLCVCLGGGTNTQGSRRDKSVWLVAMGTSMWVERWLARGLHLGSLVLSRWAVGQTHVKAAEGWKETPQRLPPPVIRLTCWWQFTEAKQDLQPVRTLLRPV